MPYFPVQTTPTADPTSSPSGSTPDLQTADAARAHRIRIKNRRKRYLDTHPSYFSPALELADPLLYDRLVRRFQTPAEREAEGRKKGYSGVLEADLLRSEAKIEALARPDPDAMTSYRRGPNGEILAEEKEDVPLTKEEGWERWKWEMEQRFLGGRDEDFEYRAVDESEEWDDKREEEREKEEEYFGEEEPGWMLEDGRKVTGETGVQDF
ncbi:hypothetical protein H2201_003705 [Coniosporium apollinis]|uniref:CCD97-like C-terminal domain-containing protein n=1 Tax=Coniosporium apollinis TaxID=61459 RepID=A0ABQ9NV61_9PEZI|nr:hypothetical protein H2201_003705 [Coniosporium apollinis]